LSIAVVVGGMVLLALVLVTLSIVHFRVRRALARKAEGEETAGPWDGNP